MTNLSLLSRYVVRGLFTHLVCLRRRCRTSPLRMSYDCVFALARAGPKRSNRKKRMMKIIMLQPMMDGILVIS